MSKATRTIVIAAASCVLLAGCDTKLGQGVTCPEVRVQYRGAIMDNSLVVIVTNAGSKPLFDIRVSSQRWDKDYSVKSTLKPGDSVEAGWLELPSGLEPGDVVEIYAEGYASPYKAEIPEKDSQNRKKESKRGRS